MVQRWESSVEQSSQQQISENQSSARRDHHNEAGDGTFPTYHETLSAADWNQIALDHQVTVERRSGINNLSRSGFEPLSINDAHSEGRQHQAAAAGTNTLEIKHENVIKRKPQRFENNSSEKIFIRQENVAVDPRVASSQTKRTIEQQSHNDWGKEISTIPSYSDIDDGETDLDKTLRSEKRINILLHELKQAELSEAYNDCERVLKNLLILPIDNKDRTKYTLELANNCIRLRKWSEAYNLAEILSIDKDDINSLIEKRFVMALALVELGDLESSQAICTKMLPLLEKSSCPKVLSYNFIHLASRIAGLKGKEQNVRFYKSKLPLNYQPNKLSTITSQTHAFQSLQHNTAPSLPVVGQVTDQTPPPPASRYLVIPAAPPPIQYQYQHPQQPLQHYQSSYQPQQQQQQQQQQSNLAGYGTTHQYNPPQPTITTSAEYPAAEYPVYQHSTLADAAQELLSLSTTGFGFRRSPSPHGLGKLGKGRRSWW